MALKYLYYVLLAVLTLGQFSRVGNYYLFDLIAGAFAFYSFLYFLLYRKMKIPRYSVLFLIFVLFAVASLIFNSQRYGGEELGTASFYLIRYLIYVMAALGVYNMVESGVIGAKELEKSLVISALFLCLAGAVQLVVLPDFSVLDPALGWDPHKNRVASTFFDPNFLGAYLVMVAVLLFGKISEGKKDRFTIVSAATITLFVFLSFSRSAWGMMAVVIFIMGILKHRKLLMVGLLVAFLTYFLVPRVQTRISGVTDPADSARFRLVSWSNALEISKDNLLTGVGFNAYRYAQKEYGFLTPDNISSRSGAGADSSILFVLATTGVFGALIYSAAYLFPLVENYFSKRKSRLMMVSFLPALLLESFFVNSLFYPQFMFVTLILIFSSSLDI